MEKDNKRAKIIGTIIACLFLVGVALVICSSILRNKTIEAYVYGIDGDTIVINSSIDGKEYTCKQPFYTKYDISDTIYIIEKNKKVTIVPNPELLDKIAIGLMVCPFLLFAIVSLIRYFMVNDGFFSSSRFKAVLFISIIYFACLGLIFFTVTSVREFDDPLVLYSLGAYIVLIWFVLFITSDTYKKIQNKRK